MCSDGVKSKKQLPFSRQPQQLRCSWQTRQATSVLPVNPRQQLPHVMMMQVPQATKTVLFSTKRSTCTTTVSWSSCSTRTRMSQAPSRPVWSVFPKARKTSDDLCVQRTDGLPQTTQPRQRHVFGRLHALVQHRSQALGHHPRLAREFVRSAVRGDCNLAGYRLARRRMSLTEAAFLGE